MLHSESGYDLHGHSFTPTVTVSLGRRDQCRGLPQLTH